MFPLKLFASYQLLCPLLVLSSLIHPIIPHLLVKVNDIGLKSDYTYSKDVVYNNFPWPNPTDEQKAKIEQTAQAILDASAKFPDASLADLYDETAMPPELRKAHQDNDRAVMKAYVFPIRGMTESRCVAELMRMYQKLTQKEG